MRMHAVRAQPDEMSVADQQPRRRGLLLLRERASQRTTLLPGARAHRVSVGRSTAQQRGCMSDDTTTAALPGSVMTLPSGANLFLYQGPRANRPNGNSHEP